MNSSRLEVPLKSIFCCAAIVLNSACANVDEHDHEPAIQQHVNQNTTSWVPESPTRIRGRTDIPEELSRAAATATSGAIIRWGTKTSYVRGDGDESEMLTDIEVIVVKRLFGNPPMKATIRGGQVGEEGVSVSEQPKIVGGKDMVVLFTADDTLSYPYPIFVRSINKGVFKINRAVFSLNDISASIEIMKAHTR